MLLADTLSRAYSVDYEQSATESEVGCIHATHFLPVPDHQLKELQREMACDPTVQFVKKAILDGFQDTIDEQPAAIHQYRISSNNGQGRLFLFSHKKGADYLREGDNLREAIMPMYFKYCSLEVALNILFYFLIKSKNNHVKYTDHGLFKCSKFSSLTDFQSLNRH